MLKKIRKFLIEKSSLCFFSKKDLRKVDHFFDRIEENLSYDGRTIFSSSERSSRVKIMLGIICVVKNNWEVARELFLEAYHGFKQCNNFKYMYVSVLFLDVVLTAIDESLYPASEKAEMVDFFTEAGYNFSDDAFELYFGGECAAKMFELSKYDYADMDIDNLLHLIYKKVFDFNPKCLT